MGTQIQQPIGSQAGTRLANQGGTVRPVYGQRRPVMYHLFENEVKSISSLNTVALSLFSVGSFLGSCVIAIVIGWGFAAPPLSEFGAFMAGRGAYFIGVLALMCFASAVWAIFQKKSIIDQIKRESKTEV